MTLSIRQKAIKIFVKKNPGKTVGVIAKAFDISPDVLRKDLRTIRKNRRVIPDNFKDIFGDIFK